jgi:hypothetical protein
MPLFLLALPYCVTADAHNPIPSVAKIMMSSNYCMYIHIDKHVMIPLQVQVKQYAEMSR